MPYFDLDPETATIHDLWGCITFPNDPISAKKYAIRDLIIWHGEIISEVVRNENIAAAMKIKKDSYPNAPEWNAQETEEELWQLFKKEIERYGGPPSMADLMLDLGFSKIIKHAEMDQGLVGNVFLTAWELYLNNINTSKEKIFKIIEKSARLGYLTDRRNMSLDIPASRNTLYKAWKNHGTVAHWIAAEFTMLYHKDMFEEEFGLAPTELDPFATDNIKNFATLAEQFLEIGSRIIVRTQKGKPQPFLNPKEAWLLPPSFPRNPVPVHKQLYLPFRTLEQWEMEIINPS